jgi:hypothetical protein
MSPAELAEAEKQVQTLLDRGWIRPSESPFSANIVFVKKPDGSLRFCVDFRALNNITVKDRYPLPRVDDLLDHLRGATVFTTLDLFAGYHQVAVDPADIYKTAFSYPKGQFEWTVMPMGLTNAGATFQRMMNEVLKPYINKFVLVYLDDVLIYSTSPEEHLKHLQQVLDTLDKHQLRIKTSKCKFARAETTFLGYKVTAAGIHVDPAKLKGIADWPLPASTTDVRAFLGFTGFYRRFIKGFATIAAPLSALTSKNLPFPPTLPSEAVDAFHTLKLALTTAPVLALPDTSPDATFDLYTDASIIGIGAVLSQYGHPIAYESRKLQPAEQNYPVHELELLAVVHALRTFRHYLEGCKQFTLHTDHHSLQYIFTQQALSRRQARWFEDLADFQPNMTIRYIPGPKNPADGLSRYPPELLSILTANPDTAELSLEICHAVSALAATDIVVTTTSLPQDIVAGYVNDPLYTPKKKPDYLQLDTETGFYMFHGRIAVPRDNRLRQRILQEYHDAPSAGHPGFHKTYSAIANKFWWPHMSRTVRSYVTTCPTCQLTKPSTQRSPGLLHPHDVPPRPWAHVSLDLITDLPPSLGPDGRTCDSIATFVDMLTKQAHFVRCNKVITAPQLAQLFLDNVYRLHGIPSKLVSDRDPRFTSDFWQHFFAALHTQINLSTAYHPQTDGQTERTHRTIEQILRAYVHPNHDDWATWLPLAEFAYNTATHRSIGTSPFTANYGFSPSTPMDITFPSTADTQPYLQRLHDIHTFIQTELQAAHDTMKDLADRRRRPLQFNIGDQVRIDANFINLHSQPSKKFRHRHLGPFKVTEVISPVAYRLDLPPSYKIHPVFHVSRLLPWSASSPMDFPERPLPPRPAPIVSDTISGPDVYEVDSVQAAALRPTPSGLRVQFRVRWAPPYSDPVHDTWEPFSHVKKLDACRAFMLSPAYATFTSSPEFIRWASRPRHAAFIPKLPDL